MKSKLLLFVGIMTPFKLPFLVADTQFYKRLCPSIGPSVVTLESWLWRTHIYSAAVAAVDAVVYVWLWWRRVRLWPGAGCRCPPVRYDIVTPRHLLLLAIYSWDFSLLSFQMRDLSRGANESKILVSDSFCNYINDQIIIFGMKFIVL